MRPISEQWSGVTKKADLHCHSCASTEADEAVLLALKCPESYSDPADVYAQAKRRGMDFVTITDHDTIAGVTTIAPQPGVIIGEELTCYFPEDRCKIHLLLWGLTETDHLALQSLAGDIRKVAEYVASHCIAHSVAHPLYRQNDVLEKWHIEQLLLMFKGFECLNGAHSTLHRDAFEPVLNDLTEADIRQMEIRHAMPALYPRPWEKARTGGSDDHGLFNIGRTWTEFPSSANTVEEILQCLREGRCRPGGEAGSSIKLAHNFIGVGTRYYARELAEGTAGAGIAGLLVGERRKGGRGAATMQLLKHKASGVIDRAGRVVGFKRRPRGMELLGKSLFGSAVSRIKDNPWLLNAVKSGAAPLAEHESMFNLVCEIARDAADGVAGAVEDAIGRGSVGEIFDAVSAILGHQALMLPYYFALFLQNRERHLFPRVTGRPRDLQRKNLRVGMFTDTTDATGRAGRFASDATRFAAENHLQLTVLTSHGRTPETGDLFEYFKPLVSRGLGTLGFELVIPPALEILEFADRRQFDVIAINTPGPMGLCGMLAAKMLRVPVVTMFHDDLFAAVLDQTSGDHRLSCAAGNYAQWFYSVTDKVVARSQAGRAAAIKLQVNPDRIVVAATVAGGEGPQPAGHPPHGRQDVWMRHRVREPVRLLCNARHLSRADFGIIAGAFSQISRWRKDIALVIVGDPCLTSSARDKLKRLPVYDVPSEAFAELCAGADLLLHPSGIDLTGQCVMDALAQGLPALVGKNGAGIEVVDDGISGVVVQSDDSVAWADAITELLANEPRRQRMARTAAQRAWRHPRWHNLETMWEQCVAVCEKNARDLADSPSSTPPAAASRLATPAEAAPA
jgi:glycosyltransferase involved in cell wall biosynthesis